MSAWKKFTAFLMSAFLLLTTGVQAFAGTSMEDALNKVNLYVKQDKGAQLLTWKGIIDSNNFAPETEMDAAVGQSRGRRMRPTVKTQFDEGKFMFKRT